MLFDTLSTAQLLAVIAILGYVTISRMLKTESSYPPQVSGTFPWVGSSIGFTLRRSKFLTYCKMRYGSVFQLLLGGRHLTVVASEEAIHNVLVSDYGVLTPRTQAYHVFRAIGSDASLYPKLYDIASQDLFLLLDKRFTKQALSDFTPEFAEVFFNKLKQFNNHQQISLRQSLTEPLYIAANAILLGTRFPPDTYNDYMTFNNSIPNRLSLCPFWPFPSTRARERLLKHMSKYVEDADVTNVDDKLGASFIEIFHERKLTNKEGAYLILSFMIALHMNVFNVVFWLIAWLLADPPALYNVRNEIDKVVREEFGGIHQFIAHVDPENLQSSSFTLLHSTILETLRMSSLLTGLRDAGHAFDLRDGEKVTPIQKGEHIIGFTWAVHRDESAYPDAHKFVVDRFIQLDSMMQIPSKAYFPFGAGKNSCKGRLLAIFEIKVLAIIYLSLFDVTPVRQGYGSSKWEPPRPSPQSTGTIHTSDDIVVMLRSRFDV